MDKIPACICLLTWYLLPLFLSGQVVVQVDQNVKLTFPGQPERLDTLGQQLYTFSDEKAYYSCIVQKVNIDASKLARMDIGEFYSELYNSIQNPADNCRTISQNEIVLGNTRAMEFYANCAESPDVPELRYKRLVLILPKLYVVDFWTTRAMFNQSGSLKNAFFESVNFAPQGGQPIIPSAVEKTDPSSPDGTNYGYFLAAIAMLLAVFLYLRKKPKK